MMQEKPKKLVTSPWQTQSKGILPSQNHNQSTIGKLPTQRKIRPENGTVCSEEQSYSNGAIWRLEVVQRKFRWQLGTTETSSMFKLNNQMRSHNFIWTYHMVSMIIQSLSYR